MAASYSKSPFSFSECREYMCSLFAQTEPRIEVSDAQLDALTTLMEMLNTWNGALNLTAIKEVKQMVLLHVVDSAVVSPVLSGVLSSLPSECRSASDAGDTGDTDGASGSFVFSVADVGTGAGFPGLVLAILHPEIHFTLIDSVGKKLSFVRQVVARLKLANVELINKRCEDIKHDPFAVIVSRAFAPLERMTNWCLPLLHEQGRFVAMKANLEQSEIQDLPRTVTIESIVELKVPSLDAKRQAVILKRL